MNIRNLFRFGGVPLENMVVILIHCLVAPPDFLVFFYQDNPAIHRGLLINTDTCIKLSLCTSITYNALEKDSALIVSVLFSFCPCFGFIEVLTLSSSGFSI